MTRRWPLGLALLAVAAAATALAVALTRHPAYSPPAGTGEDVAVQHATLRPGELLLAVRNGSEAPIGIAQVIVNDGFVDFPHAAQAIAPGSTARVSVPYPWIEGESYELELFTTTGKAILYGIDDASAS